MQSGSVMKPISIRPAHSGSRPDSTPWPVWLIAAVIVALHLATNGRYGFHRDELQFLSDARHLDWGFVAYPPLTPVVERISMTIFGLSLVGLRLFSVLAQALAIVVTGWMAAELGGSRLAQTLAALAVALSPLPLFEGTEFQYSTFDYLWWVLAAYSVIRLLKTEDARWWLAIGAAVGLGLETKYTICFFICGIVAGMLLTRARRFALTGWFWCGIGVALLIFLPNFLWQVRHGFISVTFLQHIHVRDVAQGRAKGFLLQQLWLCTNIFAVPLWIAGLVGYLRDRRYRMLGWMYLVPLALFAVGQGRSYYLAAGYPMLVAMGACMGEHWIDRMKRGWRWTVEGVLIGGMVVYGAIICAVLIPMTSGGQLKQFALKNNGDLREEIGWQELIQKVVAIRDGLPAEQRGSVGVVTGNYGEQGAVEILGAQYGLPVPISGTNSSWLRGYPSPAPKTLIVLGLSRSEVDSYFTSCYVAGHNANSEGVKNEESEFHPDIFVCDGSHVNWPELWKGALNFG